MAIETRSLDFTLKGKELFIAGPKKFEQILEKENFSSLEFKDKGPIRLSECKIQLLVADGPVVLDRCSIDVVRAAGNVLCRDCEHLGRVESNGDFCTVNCHKIDQIDVQGKVYLTGTKCIQIVTAKAKNFYANVDLAFKDMKAPDLTRVESYTMDVPSSSVFGSDKSYQGSIDADDRKVQDADIEFSMAVNVGDDDSNAEDPGDYYELLTGEDL